MHTPTDNPGTHVELKETPYKGWYLSGFMMLLVVLIIIPALMVFAMSNIEEHTAWAAPLSVLLVVLFIFCCVGYVVQEPNETRVMIFFGKYMGTFSKVVTTGSTRSCQNAKYRFACATWTSTL